MSTPAPNETLLSTSAVYLFGRLLSDLLLVKQDPQDAVRPPRKGKNTFVQQQLRNNDAGFARIFYFSFEGGLFELARPALFLVHGGGVPADTPPADDPNFEGLARSPGRITRTGLAWHVGSFASDMRVWVYDKGDFSIRMDADTGPLEQILLAAESGDSAFGSSAMARSSGAFARSSGAMARSSGVMARSSGARRSGDVD
ncbi:hypothetical protein [Dongia sp.]|uniref:hypothetical protein n=1 Tax=Dongia sp. TaxID=1977262 RepID=UPI0037534DB4